MNFLISAQHIYGYFLEGNTLHLLTRYINVSIIFIFIFTFLFLEIRKIPYPKFLSAGLFILLLALLFFMGKTGQWAQNIDIGLFYKIPVPYIGEKQWLESAKYLLLPFIAVPFILLMKNKTNIIGKFLVAFFISFAVLSCVWITKFPLESPILDFFKNIHNKKITYVVNEGHQSLSEHWNLLAMTDHDVNYKVIYEVDFKNPAADYFISEIDLKLPVVKIIDAKVKIYSGRAGGRTRTSDQPA